MENLDKIKQVLGEIGSSDLNDCIGSAYVAASLLHQGVQTNPEAVAEILDIFPLYQGDELKGYSNTKFWNSLGFGYKDNDFSKPIANYLDHSVKTCYQR
ncbi:MAG: hypothetical protein AAF526_08410 [Pseudomonadota bacterium]